MVNRKISFVPSCERLLFKYLKTLEVTGTLIREIE